MMTENHKREILNQQMRQMIETLHKWDYEYYILNKPSVEDDIYDQKLRELRELEKKTSIVLKDSPTNQLNSKIYRHSKLKFVKRVIPMLSIENTNSEAGLLAFDKRVRRELKGIIPEYICELKIDGLSASILYKNCQLIQISTRGNGLLGEDVTANKGIISALPITIANEDLCEVRGEVYMEKKEFLTLNSKIVEEGTKELANARNAAAGALRALLPNKYRKLNFFAYQYFNQQISNQQQCLESLVDAGFKVAEYRLCRNTTEISDYLKEIANRREQLPFSIDGIVVKVNSYDQQRLLGEATKFPRWAIAYKFPSLSAVSTVRKIDTAVSKNGRITYVAIIDKILIAGSVIGRVTLHNFAFIKNKHLNIGDEIVVSKSGDVIPQITEVFKVSEQEWKAPDCCPSCADKLTWEKNFLYQNCPNRNCRERIVSYLVFFASKAAIDIKGASRSTIQKLFDLKLVTKPYEFYHLANKHSELIKVNAFGEKTIANLLNAIEASRYKDFASFVTAFSIPLLSLVKARKLASLFDSDIQSFLSFVKKGNFAHLENELGMKTAAAVKSFFSNPLEIDNFEKSSAEIIFIKA